MSFVSNVFEVTSWDAHATTYFMSYAPIEGLLDLSSLSTFQRQQMDANYDFLFGDTPCVVSSYDNPCPNGGSDANFILRYIVKKYNWVDLDVSTW